MILSLQELAEPFYMLQQRSKNKKSHEKKGKALKKTLSETSHEPSKIYGDNQAQMSPSKYESQKRGPTAQAMANMKNEAKNNYEFTQLIQDLYKLRIEPLSKDEQLATDNILKRKCFGYQHFVNIADEINIICFTEGSLRWLQEISKKISIPKCSWLQKIIILCIGNQVFF